jgi:hypothetical protein
MPPARWTFGLRHPTPAVFVSWAVGPNSLLVELTINEPVVEEAIFALTSICTEKLVSLTRQW